MKKPPLSQFLVFKCALLFLLSLSIPAFADQALVPQSGQTVCYDAAGVEMPCTGTGQDGDQQMGIAWPNPRFTDNSNGTITDNLTGLIWLKNANCYNQAWTAALTFANTLASGACGLTDGSVAGDWRLPNRKELKSLINRQQANSATWLSTVGFSNVASTSYWSSTTYANSTSSAWIVYMVDGNVSFNNKTSWFIVWPVRGGQ